ncbi:hypothetical protein MMC20_001047 [Loxospora ochrophaea]|nr:hypothetical protein [Loxospora ochrophaea]
MASIGDCLGEAVQSTNDFANNAVRSTDGFANDAIHSATDFTNSAVHSTNDFANEQIPGLAQEAASSFVSALENSKNPDNDFEKFIRDAMNQADGLGESIAAAVYNTLENTLKEDSPLQGALAEGHRQIASEHLKKQSGRDICGEAGLGIEEELMRTLPDALTFAGLTKSRERG